MGESGREKHLLAENQLVEQTLALLTERRTSIFDRWYRRQKTSIRNAASLSEDIWWEVFWLMSRDFCLFWGFSGFTPLHFDHHTTNESKHLRVGKVDFGGLRRSRGWKGLESWKEGCSSSHYILTWCAREKSSHDRKQAYHEREALESAVQNIGYEMLGTQTSSLVDGKSF